jgi:quinol monooxygenase YgiN
MAAVKEVVVYVVHESALATLAEASAAMQAFLATRAGFHRRTVHRDAKNAHRFMDIVEWSSLAEAEAAAQAAETEASVAAFMAAISNVEMMNHFCT